MRKTFAFFNGEWYFISGKYKNYPVREVPESYCCWTLSNMDFERLYHQNKVPWTDIEGFKQALIDRINEVSEERRSPAIGAKQVNGNWIMQNGEWAGCYMEIVPGKYLDFLRFEVGPEGFADQDEFLAFKSAVDIHRKERMLGLRFFDGKYCGWRISEVPEDYLKWRLSAGEPQTEREELLRYSIRQVLNRISDIKAEILQQKLDRQKAYQTILERRETVESIGLDTFESIVGQEFK